MEEKKQVPAWKAFEDAELAKEKEKNEKLALFYLLEYLDKNKIVFYLNKDGNLVNISCASLISRKEIVKILLLTKGYLGIQILNGEIGIYNLYTKINR